MRKDIFQKRIFLKSTDKMMSGETAITGMEYEYERNFSYRKHIAGGIS